MQTFKEVLCTLRKCNVSSPPTWHHIKAALLKLSSQVWPSDHEGTMIYLNSLPYRITPIFTWIYVRV